MEVDKGDDKVKRAAKSSGLAAFSSKNAINEQPTPNPERITRGKGDTVAITVRLTKSQWLTLRTFAMSQGETLQTVAVNGFNRELIAAGLPPLDK